MGRAIEEMVAEFVPGTRWKKARKKDTRKRIGRYKRKPNGYIARRLVTAAEVALFGYNHVKARQARERRARKKERKEFAPYDDFTLHTVQDVEDLHEIWRQMCEARNERKRAEVRRPNLKKLEIGPWNEAGWRIGIALIGRRLKNLDNEGEVCLMCRARVLEDLCADCERDFPEWTKPWDMTFMPERKWLKLKLEWSRV
jgi:hypothetical protein